MEVPAVDDGLKKATLRPDLLLLQIHWLGIRSGSVSAPACTRVYDPNGTGDYGHWVLLLRIPLPGKMHRLGMRKQPPMTVVMIQIDLAKEY